LYITTYWDNVIQKAWAYLTLFYILNAFCLTETKSCSSGKHIFIFLLLNARYHETLKLKMLYICMLQTLQFFFISLESLMKYYL